MVLCADTAERFAPNWVTPCAQPFCHSLQHCHLRLGPLLSPEGVGGGDKRGLRELLWGFPITIGSQESCHHPHLREGSCMGGISGVSRVQRGVGGGWVGERFVGTLRLYMEEAQF